MKRTTIIILLITLLSVMAGCGAEQDLGTEDASVPENPSSCPEGLAGTWQTASMGYEEDGTISPEYHVQFTAGEVIYGHIIDGSFVTDHADPIVKLEEADGRMKVQASAANGVQYTYMTSESDADVLEYFETWNEDAFPDMYRGGASLSRCS